MSTKLLEVVPRRGRAFAVALATAAVACLGVAGSASAFNIWEKFKNCPTANPNVVYCAYGVTEKTSYLKAGLKEIILKKALILQGGISQIVLLGPEPETFYAPENGTPILSPKPQPIEGGIQSVVNESLLSGKVLEEYKKIVKEGKTKTYATIELVSNASVYFNFYDLLRETGPAIGLPLKVKFTGKILGEHCYAGSDSSPIWVYLTTGTTSPPEPNLPMTGKFGHLSEPRPELRKVTEDSLVENSFATPAIEGCGSEPEVLDAAINSAVGLPSPAGTNETRINGKLFMAFAPEVVNQGF